MLVVNPQFAVAKVLRDRIRTLSNINCVAADLSYQSLATRAKRSGDTFVVVSPEDMTRTVASRRRVGTGSAQFVIGLTISKHTGNEAADDEAATEAFLNTVQSVIDAAMGITDDTPDGTDISLPTPWGGVRWPEEVTEIPADEELSSLSLRVRTVQFQFQTNRGA